MYASKHKELNNFSRDLVERAERAVATECGRLWFTGVEPRQIAELLTGEAHAVAYTLEKLRRDFFDAHYDAIVKKCQLLRIEDAIPQQSATSPWQQHACDLNGNPIDV